MKKIKYLATSIFLVYSLHRSRKSYRIEIVKDKNLIKRVFKLRYKLYCETYKLLDKGDYPNRKEEDEYDQYSEQIAVFDDSDNMVGTVRIIKNSPIGFPTEKEFDLKIDNRKRNQTIEISRIMVEPDFKKTMLFIDVLKAVYTYTKRNNCKYWIGCAEDWFIKNINKLFREVKIIGESKFCFNALNYPFFMEVRAAERAVKKSNYLLFYYFNHS